MCIPKGFFGLDFDGDGEVSAFESFLTYQAMNDTIDNQNSDIGNLDDIDDLDDFGSFDDE